MKTSKPRRRLALVAAFLAAFAIAPAGADSAANVCSCSQAQPSTPGPVMVLTIGDSILYGVGSIVEASWRSSAYFASRAAADPRYYIYFDGTQVFGGNTGLLAADPYNEGHPGFVIATGQGVAGSLIDITTGLGSPIACNHTLAGPVNQIVVLAGGTNDLAPDILNATPAATAAQCSAWLDQIWAARTTNDMQIVLLGVLKRLDATDSLVQAYNALLVAVVAAKSYAANITLAAGPGGYYDVVANPTIYDPTTNPTGGYHDAVHMGDNGYINAGTWLFNSILKPLIQTKFLNRS